MIKQRQYARGRIACARWMLVGLMLAGSAGAASPKPVGAQGTFVDLAAVTDTAGHAKGGTQDGDGEQTEPTTAGADDDEPADATSNAVPIDDDTFTPQTSCIDPAPTSDEVPYEIAVGMQFYVVDADTMPGLREQMNQRSPNADAAHVDWLLSWDIDWDACDGSGVEVVLEINYSMPRWNRPEGVDQDVIDGWDGFIDGLWCHEYGHAQFGISIAEEGYLALSELPEPDDCEHLAQMGKDAFSEISEHYRAEEITYDEDTDHGRTTGARLPTDP